MTTIKKRKLIGHVGVDTGTIYIGDPCNFMDKREWDAFTKQHKLSASTRPQPIGPQAAGSYTAIVSPTGHGDGIYPVYAEMEGDRVLSLTISFDTDEA
jgi:hypothetical protein